MPLPKLTQKLNPFSQIIFSPFWFIQFLYLIIVSFVILKSVNAADVLPSSRDIIGIFTPKNLLYLAIFLFFSNIFLYKYWQEKRQGDLNPFAFLNLIFLICASVVWYEYLKTFVNLQNI